LKKRSKKLLIFTRAFATPSPQRPRSWLSPKSAPPPQLTKVFCFFFSKKKRFLPFFRTGNKNPGRPPQPALKFDMISYLSGFAHACLALAIALGVVLFGLSVWD
jgi:hypothetical protein